MRQKIVFLGNCQGGALKTLLDSTEVFSKHFDITKILVHSVKANNVNEIINIIKQSTYLVYQPISKNYKGIQKLSSDYLQKLLSERVKMMSFPSIYFNGYTPHIVHLRRKDGSRFLSSQENELHDRNIIFAFYEGKTVEQTYQNITHDSFYSKESSLNFVSNAIKELKRREKEQNIDIVVSDIIENNYQKTLLFNTVNHPTSKLLTKVAIRIANQIGVELDEKTIAWPNVLTTYSLYIYCSTYENLRLKFLRRPYHEYNSNKISVKDNIEQAFALYQSNQDEIEYAIAGIKAHDFTIKTFALDLPKFIAQADREICSETNYELNKQLISGKLSRKIYAQSLYYKLGKVEAKSKFQVFPVKSKSKPALDSQLFVIFAHSHISSQYLTKVLNSLQNFECLGATFNRKTVWIPYQRKQEFIEWLKVQHDVSIQINKNPFEDRQLVKLIHQKPQLLLNFLQETAIRKYVGFKVFPENLSFPQIREFLLSNRKIKKIILKRNLLDAYVSEKVTQNKNCKKNLDKLFKVTINNSDFERWYTKTISYYSKIETFLTKINCQWSELHYENINQFSENNSRISYIHSWLTQEGFEIADASSNCHNKTTNNIIKKVKNHQEFLAFLNKKEFCHLLN